jgi:hypothetical protein
VYDISPEALGANQHVVRDSSVNRVRPSDIGLTEFSGAHDKFATVIEPEFYPRLLLWLEESENLLRNSGLPVMSRALLHSLSTYPGSK